MRVPSPSRRSLVIVVAALALVGLAVVSLYLWRVNRSIADAKKEREAAATVEVQEVRLRPPATDGLTLFLDSAGVRAVSTFEGSRYLATCGGLAQLDESGRVKRRYTTMDGLPDNDLTTLAVFNGHLFIGTATHGLLAFDGNAFTSYSFKRPKAAAIQVLQATPTELLIGTADAGLFEFDGQRFTRRFQSAAGGDFSHVTALLSLDSRLYVGTQDQGLFIWKEAHFDHVAAGAAGLPSPHVTGLAALRGSYSKFGIVAVATDFGSVGLDDSNQVKQINARPNVTSLATGAGHLWAGLFGGGIVDLAPAREDREAESGRGADSSDTVGLPHSAPAVVEASDGRLWALTTEGAYFREDGAVGPKFEAFGEALAGDRALASGHITGVACDAAGRLWIGYFDRGIDQMAPQTGERLAHIEDERVREINFLKFDASNTQMLAATSRGLVMFDGRLKQTVLSREQGGLISSAVSHVAFADAEADPPSPGKSGAAAGGRITVLATAGGLTEISAGRARSLTAFHGLPSNHLYTSAAIGSRLFVGTLAGLGELEGLRVVRTYKTSNSALSHDWVTALAESGGTLYVGTNGGGVDALLPTGEWISFSADIGRFEVNQNAMYIDRDRLYVGTADRGLLVYDIKARRWIDFTTALPSQNITAITSDDRYVYVGTLNGLMRIEKRVIM